MCPHTDKSFGSDQEDDDNEGKKEKQMNASIRSAAGSCQGLGTSAIGTRLWDLESRGGGGGVLL